MFSPPTGLSADNSAQVGFFFHVVIGGNPLGEFRAVHGLGRSIDPEEIREGGRNYSPHLRLGQSKYQACKIEWGLSIRATLFDWINAVDAGYGFKRLVNIFQLDPMMRPVRVYTLWDAWPISWEGANLDANQDTLDTEEITIVYELITMVAMPTLPDMGIQMRGLTVAPTAIPTAAGPVGFVEPSTEEPAESIEYVREKLVTTKIGMGAGSAVESAFSELDLEKNSTIAAASAFEALITSKGVKVAATERKAVSLRSAVVAEDTTDPDTSGKKPEAKGLKMSGGKKVAATENVVVRMSGGLSFEPTVFEPIVTTGKSDGS